MLGRSRKGTESEELHTPCLRCKQSTVGKEQFTHSTAILSLLEFLLGTVWGGRIVRRSSQWRSCGLGQTICLTPKHQTGHFRLSSKAPTEPHGTRSYLINQHSPKPHVRRVPRSRRRPRRQGRPSLPHLRPLPSCSNPRLSSFCILPAHCTLVLLFCGGDFGTFAFTCLHSIPSSTLPIAEIRPYFTGLR